MLFQVLLILMASGAALGESAAEIRVLMAKDILSRMEHDFFHYASKTQNVAKLLKDCDFQPTDLTGHGTNEVIVKLNWFVDARLGFPEDIGKSPWNYARGAHGNGAFYIYSIQDQQPVFLGIIGGDGWVLLPSKSKGWMDIETSCRFWGNESVIEIYKYSKGIYRKVSSILYQFDENGNRKQLEVFSLVPHLRTAVRIKP
jgi:hypothetical protein